MQAGIGSVSWSIRFLNDATTEQMVGTFKEKSWGKTKPGTAWVTCDHDRSG
jgi:hypothetical protein